MDSINNGLTSAEVAERVARGETNDYKVRVGRTYVQILRDNVFNIFNLILFALVAILVANGDIPNAVFASFSVTLNSVVGLWQEISAKRALDQLAAMSVQESSVIRDGKLQKVPILQIVKDDILPIEPGDRIVVDGVALKTDALEIDESSLTGESDAIQKEPDSRLLSGSFVIAGSGVMRATEVGAHSTVNKLSQTAKAYKNPLTPTQREISRIVQFSLIGMLIFGVMTIFAGVATGLEQIEIVRNAVVLVTSFVPQGLVLATTVSLTLGALRISRRETLVQRVNAVESLANVNVLCFDKTGTLTRNILTVDKVMPLNGGSESDLKRSLTDYTAALGTLNKTAAAIAQFTGVEAGKTLPAGNKIGEISFTSARKWGAVQFADVTYYLGAPERVLHTDKEKPTIEQAAHIAAGGQRVLAFARTNSTPSPDQIAPDRQSMGLIVMSDQVRTEIADTLKAFGSQGVELKVISGDNAETVSKIASDAGMHVRRAMTGDEVEQLRGADLDAACKETNVFARIEPETKRKIIRTLREGGAYVAMVGDGVNDVPALKEANMAVAMNDGAQIAKDVADVVLLNNSMSTLPLAFEEGKSITQKIFAVCRLFLTKNFYTILMFIFIGYMSMPFPVTPIGISWLTFGIVNIPALLITFGLIKAIRFRNFEKDVANYLFCTVLVGAIVGTAVYTTLYLSRVPGMGSDPSNLAVTIARNEARSGLLMWMFLYGLVIFWQTHGVNIMRPITMRRRLPITFLGGVITALSVALIFVLREGLFVGFIPPNALEWFIIFGAFLIAVVALEWALRGGRLRRLLTQEGL